VATFECGVIILGYVDMVLRIASKLGVVRGLLMSVFDLTFWADFQSHVMVLRRNVFIVLQASFFRGRKQIHPPPPVHDFPISLAFS